MLNKYNMDTVSQHWGCRSGGDEREGGGGKFSMTDDSVRLTAMHPGNHFGQLLGAADRFLTELQSLWTHETPTSAITEGEQPTLAVNLWKSFQTFLANEQLKLIDSLAVGDLYQFSRVTVWQR